MGHAPVDENAFDRSEFEKAGQQIRLINKTLPAASVEAMAKEVVKRLAFRMPRAVDRSDLPQQSDIDLLCAALLSKEEDTADKIILDARRDGVNIEVIYLGYLAGAARLLGKLWQEDKISFVDVTLGTGRLYRIIRGLRHVVATVIKQGREERPAMFALVPGETHSLGIEMATDLFRREGWEVDMFVGLDHDTLIEQSEERSYSAIVLVANSEQMIEPLTRVVLAMRITHPTSHVIIAGNILSQFPHVVRLVGADSAIPDIRTAAATLRGVIDAQAD